MLARKLFVQTAWPCAWLAFAISLVVCTPALLRCMFGEGCLSHSTLIGRHCDANLKLVGLGNISIHIIVDGFSRKVMSAIAATNKQASTPQVSADFDQQSDHLTISLQADWILARL